MITTSLSAFCYKRRSLYKCDYGISSLNVDISKFHEEEWNDQFLNCPISKILHKMLEEGLHSDMILEARGGSVKAHRSVLASCSPVFNAMFNHQMQEQLNSTVKLPSMTIDGLQLFLVFLYLLPDDYSACLSLPLYARLDGAGDKNVYTRLDKAVDVHLEELIEASQKYQVTKLDQVFVDAMPRNLTPSGCWNLLFKFEDACPCAQSDSCRGPHKGCDDYIVENFNEVLETESIRETMLSHPDIVIFYMKRAMRKASSKSQPLSRHLQTTSHPIH